MQNIVILGSTGSVGINTLDVISRHSDRFQVLAISAQGNIDKLVNQCVQFQPRHAVVADASKFAKLKNRLRQAGVNDVEIACGQQALENIASHGQADTVMSAIVGAAGLLPTLAAVRAGKRVLIANKEPLVMTGDLFMREARASGATILPIDSEHNAVFQCLPEDQNTTSVNKIHLTASGGPFLGKRWASLKSVTPEQACAHPNWSMGPKISVDSATMMNKGLELIEAAALFDLPVDRVEILMHPQSIVHSLVEYCDGSFLAQLGAPDMRIPIAYALAWPQRLMSGADRLNLADMAKLEFRAPDMSNLPCLGLARQAARQGGAAPVVLNAANERAVAAFLAKKLPFTAIPEVIDGVLEKLAIRPISGLQDVLNIDNEARRLATEKLDSLSH